MKFFQAICLAAVVTPGVFARYCTNNLKYCGKTLLDIGNYDAEIRQALQRIGIQNPNWHDISNAIFYCEGSSGIKLIEVCHLGCEDYGHWQSDHCFRRPYVDSAPHHPHGLRQDPIEVEIEVEV